MLIKYISNSLSKYYAFHDPVKFNTHYTSLCFSWVSVPPDGQISLKDNCVLDDVIELSYTEHDKIEKDIDDCDIVFENLNENVDKDSDFESDSGSDSDNNSLVCDTSSDESSQSENDEDEDEDEDED